MRPFSYFERANIRKNLSSEHYDLIIIGGGITGAGIALDAVTRGMKVALIEKNDFASGTSSKSTKLIHGGLRYLKQLHFKMVADVGRERKIVHELAPHLVLPEKMLLPIFKGASMGKFSISLGLKFYDALAGVSGDDQRKMLNKKETLNAEPLLPEDKVTGGGLYAEYRTDDARLTIEIAKTAYERGADLLNYVKMEDFIYEQDQIKGLECYDHISQENFAINGRHVINAAGPWVDDIRRINQSRKGKQLHITKGVHLVVDRKKLPVNQSLYSEIGDGRMIFIIPRLDTTYIGTTDTDYYDDKDDLKVSRADAEYLLDAVNGMLPGINLKMDDIDSSWAGLRPLIQEEGKSAGEISRKDEVFVSDSGLISIAGGKLTGYRKMAARVVDMVAGNEFGPCRTVKIPLRGNGFNNFEEVRAYTSQVADMLQDNGIPDRYAPYLVHNYGVQTDMILKMAAEQRTDDPEEKLLMSELHFCVEEEMVCHPLDFIDRRTGRLYFLIGSIKQYAGEILSFFRDRYEIPDDRFREMEEEVDRVLKLSHTFQ